MLVFSPYPRYPLWLKSLLPFYIFWGRVFFCLICEQVGCSPQKMKRVWKSCLLCGHPAIVTHNVQCGKRRDTLIQAASNHLLSPAWFGFVSGFFLGFWDQLLGVIQLQLWAGSCLIVVICLDIIFIVCQIIMMIIYETECLKRFPLAWEPMTKKSWELETQPTPTQSICNSIMDEPGFWLIFPSCCFIMHLTTRAISSW